MLCAMVTFMQSKRLRYRCLEPSDADDVLAILNDAQVRRYLDTRVHPMGRMAEVQFLEAVSKETSRVRADVVFRVDLADGSQMVGVTGLHHTDWVNRSAEWGISLAPAHWNQGFGREIVLRMQQYAFEELCLHRVWLRVHLEHQAARHLYASVGFLDEGVLRGAVVRDGEHRDLGMMSMLAPEYRSLRASRS